MTHRAGGGEGGLVSHKASNQIYGTGWPGGEQTKEERGGYRGSSLVFAGGLGTGGRGGEREPAEIWPPRGAWGVWGDF